MDKVSTDKTFELTEYSVFSLAKDKSPAEVTLRSADWAIITQIDGHKSVGEISEILAFSVDEAIEHFTWLYDKGLIKFLSAQKLQAELLSPDFFEKMETELTKIIGPVAPFVLNDVFWNMDVKKENFLLSRTAELIEAVSDEISDEEKKVNFQQVMLESMKEFVKE